ncbi:Outer membrane protein assembly factor BamD [Marinomonas aquimarina]|uniref:Cell division coordinator CpoB n=1 Tax=Marinomonas aquimarina TaxID=295068 RepID=A0A1A8TEZ5_9GAMM|nr:tol-pal system protein YbgF [Marinomonas aquimarina]SBS31882.1 Outer membrane protein assembly factor BamD [Marinomonas aquimarina]
MSTRFKISSLALVLTLSAPIATANTISPNVAADLLYQLEMLQQEVSHLRGQVEQQQYELNKLQALSKDRYIDLDKRVSDLTSKVASAPSVAPAANTSQTNVANANSASQSKSVPVATAPVRPVKLEEPSAQAKVAYDEAYDLIRAKNFEGAQTALRSFVKTYPNNSLTGNGHYWLGELALVLGNQGEALVQFQTVQDDFAGHAKVPDAIYKLGIVNDQLGNQSMAREYLQRVIVNYPDSNSATLATNYLNNMK